MPSSTAPSTRAAHRHKGAASSQPTSGLVAIRARHAFQCSHALTISAFVSLLSDLNSSWEVDHRRGTQLSRDDRIASFREDWLMGLLARVRPLQLLADDECETYSDGNASPSSRRSSSLAPSVVTTSSSSDYDDNNDDAVVLPAEARQHLVPPDAMSRGVLAERTIKRALSLRRQLLPHRDLSSLASVARRAMRQTLATGRPVFVAPGLVDSVDWTGEYRERGWAAPGVRWGVFRPDLIRFEEVKRRGAGEEGERLVSWEVVEVKWSGKANDFIYTNWKVQAGFYHLSLARLLSAIPLLVPSHKLSFFISRDPLSPAYDERPLAVRTVQAFVEHHLFVLLPRWLDAVTEEEWGRLQEGLRPQPETPTKGESASQTFLEKLQASVKATPPPTPGRARRRPPSPIKHVLQAGASSPAQAPPLLPPPKLRLPLQGRRTPLPPLDTLPPLPPVDADEERNLLVELLERVALG